MNHARCCKQDICTGTILCLFIFYRTSFIPNIHFRFHFFILECFLQLKPFNSSEATCPFCNRTDFHVYFTGPKSKAERKAEEEVCKIDFICFNWILVNVFINVIHFRTKKKLKKHRKE